MKTMTNNNVNVVKVMNKKSIMGKMKMLVLALVGVMALGFTSCSSDDDSSNPSFNQKATQATAQPVLYITDSMLDVFDITYVSGGETVVLTRENTTLSPTSTDKLRSYTGKLNTYTSFPASLKATATMKVKDNIDLKTMGTTKLVLTFGLEANNNGNGWDVRDIKTSIQSTGCSWAKMTDEGIAEILKKNTSSMEASFANAASVKAQFKSRVAAE